MIVFVFPAIAMGIAIFILIYCFYWLFKWTVIISIYAVVIILGMLYRAIRDVSVKVR